jgi:hypothetical protein
MTATMFLLLDLATFFDLFHGGKLDDALETLEKIKIIPLTQQDVDYLVAGKKGHTRDPLWRKGSRHWRGGLCLEHIPPYGDIGAKAMTVRVKRSSKTLLASRITQNQIIPYI